MVIGDSISGPGKKSYRNNNNVLWVAFFLMLKNIDLEPLQQVSAVTV